MNNIIQNKNEIVDDFLNICQNVSKNKDKLRKELTNIIHEIQDLEKRKSELESDSNNILINREEQIAYCNEMIENVGNEINEIRHKRQLLKKNLIHESENIFPENVSNELKRVEKNIEDIENLLDNNLNENYLNKNELLREKFREVRNKLYHNRNVRLTNIKFLKKKLKNDYQKQERKLKRELAKLKSFDYIRRHNPHMVKNQLIMVNTTINNIITEYNNRIKSIDSKEQKIQKEENKRIRKEELKFVDIPYDRELTKDDNPEIKTKFLNTRLFILKTRREHIWEVIRRKINENNLMDYDTQENDYSNEIIKLEKELEEKKQTLIQIKEKSYGYNALTNELETAKNDIKKLYEYGEILKYQIALTEQIQNISNNISIEIKLEKEERERIQQELLEKELEAMNQLEEGGGESDETNIQNIIMNIV